MRKLTKLSWEGRSFDSIQRLLRIRGHIHVHVRVVPGEAASLHSSNSSSSSIFRIRVLCIIVGGGSQHGRNAMEERAHAICGG